MVAGGTPIGQSGLIAQLARNYNLGQLGKARPGTQEGGRPELDSVAEIVNTLRASHLLPSAAEGAKKVWSYRCSWIDDATGDRLGGGAVWTIETDMSGTYQRASAAARRLMLSPNPNAVSPPPPTGPNVRLECRRIGDVFIIPTGEP